MKTRTRSHLPLITGMAVSLVGSEMVRIYAHQPEYFENQWIGMAGWYAVSLAGGAALVLAVLGLKRVSPRLAVAPHVLLALLFVLYAQIQINVAVGPKLLGVTAQLKLIAGLAAAISVFLAALPPPSRRKAIHAACFMAVFASVAYDLIDWSRLALSAGTGRDSASPAQAAAAKPPRNLHVFEILLDGMPGYDFIHNPVLAREAFFRDLPAGILYPNTYANGHKTTISTEQLFSGLYDGSGRKKSVLFGELMRNGYRVNIFSEFERDSCRDLPSSSCFDRKWAIETGMFKQRPWRHLLFQMEQLLHAYFLRINLPGLSDQVAFAQAATRSRAERRRARQTMRANETSAPLVLFREYVRKLDSLKEPSYNLLHIEIPHPPNIHDRDCNVIASGARTMVDVSGFRVDASDQQVLCANKLARALLAELRKKNLFDSSLIIVHSDHGDGPGYLNFVPDSEHFESVKQMPRDEIIERRGRALLWVKPPGFQRTEVRDHTALLLDIPATVGPLLGLDLKTLDGMDLLDGHSTDRARVLDSRKIYASNSFSRPKKGSYVLKRLPDGRWVETTSTEAEAAARRKFL